MVFLLKLLLFPIIWASQTTQPGKHFLRNVLLIFLQIVRKKKKHKAHCRKRSKKREKFVANALAGTLQAHKRNLCPQYDK